jgi:hypothetical protein
MQWRLGGELRGIRSSRPSWHVRTARLRETVRTPCHGDSEQSIESEDVMEVEFLPCPTCAVVVVVDVPPCAEGHAPEECPERACTQCGAALLRDPLVLVLAPTRRRSAA